jgi:DNA polymerase III subunit epsilon
MQSLWDTPFVVIDVETSGPNHLTNRIIEIGCVMVQGGEIIEEFESLINPHQFIPPYIVKMTGINYKMAFQAPEMSEVFPRLKAYLDTPNAIFVAHNATFDWSFIKSAYYHSGYESPSIPRLCTIKLARRLIAKSQKKNLSALAEYFKVSVKNRHRALGDAQATAQILIDMLEIMEQEHNVDSVEELLKFQNRPIKPFLAPTEINEKMEPVLEQLPNEAGVYYFVDKNNKILYVGKAKSLSSRVRSYFQADAVNSRKISAIMKQLDKIHWTETDTELSALILESREIKRHKPPFNVLEKHYRSYPFLQITSDERFPRIDFIRDLVENTSELYGPFRNAALVDDLVNLINKQFKLRKCTINIQPNPQKKPCFYYHIERCSSPCSSTVNDIEYHEEVQRVREYLSSFGNGIIKQLEDKMAILSENLNFEEASTIKDRLQELMLILDRNSNVATSINNYNLILVIPASEREKTLEIFIIKNGIIFSQKSIGRKASLAAIKNTIHEAFYNGIAEQKSYSQENIDELRIINSWLHRNRSESKFIYLDGHSETAINDWIESAISSSYMELVDESFDSKAFD